jgi:crotonobetainyl-CoA:carnitine CoA-transferase CaiB-like acyl-CoA transferase
MTGTPCEVRSAAPMPGADTDDVFRSLLGFSPEQIDQLRAAAVIK